MSRRRSKNRQSGSTPPPSGYNRAERRDREFSQMWNEYFAPEPTSVNGQFNLSSLFYQERLRLLIYALFDFTGIPDNWDIDYFREFLFDEGLICITDTTAGIVALQTGITGHNIYNRPTECVIANVVLGNFRRTIDEDCVLVKLQYNYRGIIPLIDRYSYLLASCDSAIAVNLMNSKVTFICGAQNDKQAKEMQVIVDQITQGQPAVYTDPENKANITFLPVKNSYVANDIFETKRRIINELLTQIGVPNTNTEKKERMIQDEVNSNNIECIYYTQNWLDNLSQSFKRANKMFGLNLGVELRYEQVRKMANELAGAMTPAQEPALQRGQNGVGTGDSNIGMK